MSKLGAFPLSQNLPIGGEQKSEINPSVAGDDKEVKKASPCELTFDCSNSSGSSYPYLAFKGFNAQQIALIKQAQLEEKNIKGLTVAELCQSVTTKKESSSVDIEDVSKIVAIRKRLTQFWDYQNSAVIFPLQDDLYYEKPQLFLHWLVENQVLTKKQAYELSHAIISSRNKTPEFKQHKADFDRLQRLQPMLSHSRSFGAVIYKLEDAMKVELPPVLSSRISVTAESEGDEKDYEARYKLEIAKYNCEQAEHERMTNLCLEQLYEQFVAAIKVVLQKEIKLEDLDPTLREKYKTLAEALDAMVFPFGNYYPYTPSRRPNYFRPKHNYIYGHHTRTKYTNEQGPLINLILSNPVKAQELQAKLKSIFSGQTIDFPENTAYETFRSPEGFGKWAKPQASCQLIIDKKCMAAALENLKSHFPELEFQFYFPENLTSFDQAKKEAFREDGLMRYAGAGDFFIPAPGAKPQTEEYKARNWSHSWDTDQKYDQFCNVFNTYQHFWSTPLEQLIEKFLTTPSYQNFENLKLRFNFASPAECRAIIKPMIEEMLQLKRARHAEEDLCIGLAYEYGVGLPKDYSLALKHYENAVKKDCELAYYPLAKLRFEGKGCTASKYTLYYAALTGNLLAISYLGEKVFVGEGLKQDFAAAAMMLENIHAEIPLNTLCRLGFLYEQYPKQKHNPYDYQLAAFSWGNPYALADLAVAYHSGKGVTQDQAMARFLFECFAKRQGHVPEFDGGALSRLASMCAKGEGGKQDLLRAAELYAKTLDYQVNAGWFLQRPLCLIRNANREELIKLALANQQDERIIKVAAVALIKSPFVLAAKPDEKSRLLVAMQGKIIELYNALPNKEEKGLHAEYVDPVEMDARQTSPEEEQKHGSRANLSYSTVAKAIARPTIGRDDEIVMKTIVTAMEAYTKKQQTLVGFNYTSARKPVVEPALDEAEVKDTAGSQIASTQAVEAQAKPVSELEIELAVREIITALRKNLGIKEDKRDSRHTRGQDVQSALVDMLVKGSLTDFLSVVRGGSKALPASLPSSVVEDPVSSSAAGPDFDADYPPIRQNSGADDVVSGNDQKCLIM